MDEKFSEGDLVQVGGAGPVMTVLTANVKSSKAPGGDGVLCEWTQGEFAFRDVHDPRSLKMVRKERRGLAR